MSKINISFPSQTFNLRDLPDSEYVLSKGLADAVQVALALQQPLLITGEPGTGKTRLAYRVARDLAAANAAFLPKPIVYETQTTASAQDLFYFYDALSHFHDANIKGSDKETAPLISDYIELRGLGKAIALSNPGQAGKGYLQKIIESDPEVASEFQRNAPKSSVVLIDEIDKAPRDFPNNLLAQLEKYAFKIREDHNKAISIGEGQQIVVILTSNSEKTLPEAFLRRCVFFHIPFPGPKQLLDIVKARIGHESAYSSEQLIAHFMDVRKAVKRKAPATAELIAWLRVLELHHFLDSTVDFNKLTDSQKDILRLSYSVLAKTQEDLTIISEKLA